MDTERIKITGSERKLSEGELEKAISLIKILPDDTFMSKEEGNKKRVEMPTYMKASELKIKYSPDAHILNITSCGKGSRKSIGGILTPAKPAYITKEGLVAFTFNKTRYLIHF